MLEQRRVAGVSDNQQVYAQVSLLLASGCVSTDGAVNRRLLRKPTA